MNYTIIQQSNGEYQLAIYSAYDQKFVTSRRYKSYISALRAVSLLQVHLYKRDRELLETAESVERQYGKQAT